MRKTGSGERVRNLLRGREALAGCRGAALTKPFWGSRQHGGSTKHTLSHAVSFSVLLRTACNTLRNIHSLR